MLSSDAWQEMTWTCHVCGDERPDAVIGVVSRLWPYESNPLGRANLRHCVDREDCLAQAWNWKESGAMWRAVKPRWWQVSERWRTWRARRIRCRHMMAAQWDEADPRCVDCDVLMEHVPWP